MVSRFASVTAVRSATVKCRPVVKKHPNTLIIGIASAWLAICGPFAAGQSYLTSTGAPSFAAPEPVELGSVDAANGNLHLSIPLGSYPQRGTSQPEPVTLEYDSSIWSVQTFSNSVYWGPSNGPAGYNNTGGWYLSSQVVAGQVGLPANYQNCTEDDYWMDQSGTVHVFHMNTDTVYYSGCPSQADAYATDSSGYHMYVYVNSTNPSPVVYAPDGTIVYAYPYIGKDSAGNYIRSKDSNGNYLSSTSTSGGSLIDTLGRQIVSGYLGGPVGTVPITVTTSMGTAQYNVVTTTINVKTAFQQSGVTEANTTMTVIRSLTLPDAAHSTYYFTYDCDSGSGNSACGSPSGQSAYYGELISVTLPTGGTADYSYTKFSDAYGNKSEWLSSHQSAGGDWTYTPAVLSSCGPTDVNCRQQTTVTSPTATTVYTFQLNNGAWPVSVVQKDGQGNTLSTITNTYDFTQPCVLINCHGNSFITLTSQQTTIASSGGNLTEQTQYSYDSPQKGNRTAVKEWGYSPSGSFAAVPDRATYMTYLTTGTNDINRPTSVTLCNGSGSDSACPGGGSKVSQTLYNYDAYGSNGLTTISGIAQHDDAGFGVSYTSRGNVTSEQHWVSGATYLTTSYAYDTTGQMLTQTDPAGNATSYSYADNFYTDGGNNTTLTAYTSPTPTNAYPTSVTDAIGTERVGYYWGSGTVAVATDYNSVSSYWHYQDGLDRQTEEIDPAGWKVATYTSSVQSDMYTAVADISPSTGCSSCQHTQTVLDNWGRISSQVLVNNPLGQVNVDSTYDQMGRLSTQTHPYTGSSDPNHVPETFGYDGLGRQISIKHADGQMQQSQYGAAVITLGGVTAQQGSTSTYGYGYPQISEDETGRQSQNWTDAFGRIIEVDEPSTSTATYATTTVSVVGGGGQEWITINPCSSHGGNCPQTIANSGYVYLTVDGYTASASYSPTGQSSYTTATQVASELAAVFNGDTASPVTAGVSGGSIVLTARGPGSSGNSISFTSSETWNTSNFSGPVYALSPSSGSLSGGSGGVSSSPYFTNYTYDSADHLTQVAQGSQTRVFSYDGLGRKISETTPEGGRVTYSYVTSGGALCSGNASNVCQRTDARGVVSTYTYDPAGHLTGVAYTIPSGKNIASMPNVCTTTPNGTGANVCYYYGQGGASSYAVGRMTEMIDPSGNENRAYDASGRVRAIAKIVNGQTYSIGYQYDAGGDVTQITYPSGRIVQQAYNAIGQLCLIAPSATGCSGSGYYAANFSYSSPGNLTGFTYGNGVFANYGYSAPRLQLSSITYGLGSQNYVNLAYWYQQNSPNCMNGNTGNNGSIQCITDSLDTGRNLRYAYDQLGRLNSASNAGSSLFPQWGVTESYDRYGNRLAQTVTAGTAPTSNLSFTANNQPVGYSYDASGNMTVEPFSPPNTMTYDGENRMTAFSGNGGAANYTYDGNGLRIIKSAVGGTTTVSIFAGSSILAEYDNGAAPGAPSREYIFNPAGGATTGLLAMVSSGTITYYHQDHLSVRLTTDPSGSILTLQGTYPFGEPWYNWGTSTSRWEFTNYSRDSESGFDYALARYYDSRTGTFCSADPLAGDPSDPQSWNRYPYGRNDPIDVTDPSGKSWWSSLLIDAGIAVGMYFAGPELANLFGTEASAAGYAAGDLPETFSYTPQLLTRGATAAITAGGDAGAGAGGGLAWGLGGAAVAAGVQATDRPKKPTATNPAAAVAASPQMTCPPVPPHPKGADVDNNINAMAKVAAADPTKSKANSWYWFVQQVRPGGPWDYKALPGGYPKWDDFGNFNYGATGAVLTNSLQTLENGAAIARLSARPLAQLKNYGFGNDPHKNEMIRQGMQYKLNDCGKH